MSASVITSYSIHYTKLYDYYATLDPPKVSPLKAEEARKTEKNPVAEGKAATAACAGCHGPDGNASIPGMPSLAGQHPEYLVAAMKAYKGTGRTDATMKSLVALLSYNFV